MSMDIRVNPRYQDKFNSAYGISTKINKDQVKLNFDAAVETAVIMIHTEGSSREWFRGVEVVLSFILNGYAKPSMTKKCPLLKGIFGQPKKCIGEKCAHYVVQFQIGDCAHVWSAIK